MIERVSHRRAVAFLISGFQSPRRLLQRPGPWRKQAFSLNSSSSLVGKPIPSHLAHHERLSRVTGLAVLSSDPLSSVAYATEEILRVLIIAGAAALTFSSPIAVVIAAILAIVVFSYRQTIHAYPSGGGAYIVAKENLGESPALIAAAALLIDYVLTVAVSIAAGVAAITSAFPGLARQPRRAGARLSSSLLTLGNLRGIRESGRIFALPTYFFIVSILALIAVGAWRVLTGHRAAACRRPLTRPGTAAAALTLFLLLTAFSNGCTAMTGVEAVSNGVPAFKPPEAKNAAATLVTMAVLSITMFLGITLLAQAYHVVPSEHETVVSQLARGVFGGRGHPVLRRAGRDDADPGAGRQHRLRRLPAARVDPRARPLPAAAVHEPGRPAGVLERHHRLSVFAGVLLVVFGGDTHALIPLYMIGVFVSFTLVAGRHGACTGGGCGRRAGGRAPRSTAFGALVTGVVLIVVAVTKAHEGAWIILLLIPVLVLFFRVDAPPLRPASPRSSRCADWQPEPRAAQHRARADQRRPARRGRGAAICEDAVAATCARCTSTSIPPRPSSCARDWARWGAGVPLVVLDSPYRSLMEPLLEYIEQVDAQRSRRLRHRRAAGVRPGAMVAPPVPQPAGAADQRRAAVQAEHRGDQRAVPSGSVTSRDSAGP